MDSLSLDPLSRQRKAMHEAAHAAVAFRLSIEIELVTIEPVWMNRQICQGGCPATQAAKQALADDPDNRLDAFAQFMLAGVAMDRLLLRSAGASVSPYQEAVWAGDFATLLQIADDLRPFPTFHDYKHWEAQQLQEVAKLLSEPPVLAGVQAIASLLMTQGEVSEAEVRSAFSTGGHP